jgi:hypothetical protein
VSEEWYEIGTAADADSIREVVVEVYVDGWVDVERIDWEQFIWELDGMRLSDGRWIDMGDSTDSEAIERVKQIVGDLRREEQS